MKVLDLVGKTFARLTVLSRAGTKDKASTWLCLCICGKERVVVGKALKFGSVKSCGCLLDKGQRAKKSHCVNGHLRTESNLDKVGNCRLCMDSRKTKWIVENLARHKATERAYYLKNINKVKRRAFTSQRKRAGWSQESFTSVFKEQRALCALCNKPFTTHNPPCADHAHTKPPKPRGILHRKCNAALGMLDDSPELCEAAALYLRKWEGLPNANFA